MFRILRSVGWFFGGGVGLFMAAFMIMMSSPGFIALSLALVVAGAILWAAFVTAVLTLYVELAEARRKGPVSRES
ncbi:MAG: hypothetical protein ACE5JE_04485 [Thermoplasmata archaeon]